MGIFDLFKEPVVHEMKAKKDIRGLIKALNYKKDWGVRSGAAEALGDIGDTRAVEPLIQALKDENDLVQSSVAMALGDIGDTRAVEPLIQALKDEDQYIRIRAAEALGNIGDTRAVEPLIQVLEDVRGMAAEALGKIGDARAIEPLIHLYINDKERHIDQIDIDKIDAALIKIGEPAVQPIIQALKDKNDDFRFRVAAGIIAKIIIKMIEDKKTLEYIINIIKAFEDIDSNGDLWWRLGGNVEILGRVVDHRYDKVTNEKRMKKEEKLRSSATEVCVKLLIQALKDENSGARKQAANFLYHLGDNDGLGEKKAVEIFVQAFRDEDSSVRWKAVEPFIQASQRDIIKLSVLVGIGDKRAAEVVINYLLNEAPVRRDDLFIDGKAMEKFFGIYAPFIPIAFRVSTYSIEFNDFKPIETLCKIHTQISTNILHQIVKLRDIKITTYASDCAHYYGTVSFDPFRKMAREELERRGNPPYNPSAYLDDKAWKI